MTTNSSDKGHALVFIGLVLAIGVLASSLSRQPAGGSGLAYKPLLNAIAPKGTGAVQSASQLQNVLSRKALHASEADFSRMVLQAPCPVLVDFHTEWCVPCRQLAPVLDELAAETAHARIVKVNVDDCPSLAVEYGIRRIPTLKVFRGGQVVGEFVGMTNKSRLQAMLR